MPRSAPAGLRIGADPSEEISCRIVIVRSARRGGSRRASLARQNQNDSFVSIDVEDDPDSVALSSQSQESDPNNPSGMGVVAESLGEPHPSSSQATSATADASCKPTCRRTQSAEAIMSRGKFRIKSSTRGRETTTVRRQASASGESNSPNISISSASVNEIRELEENEVQPGPSRAHHSTSISSIEDEIQALGEGKETPETETDSGSVSVKFKLNPKASNESLDLDASKSEKFTERMKRLLSFRGKKKPTEEIELYDIEAGRRADSPHSPLPENRELPLSCRNLFTIARDLASATASTSAHAQEEEERDNGSTGTGAEGDEWADPCSSTPQARPRNARMRRLVRAQMAANAMREAARKNAFVGTLAVFQEMMFVGYHLGVIPFRILFNGKKYVIETSRFRQIFVFVMLLLVTWWEARNALVAVQLVNIKESPGSLFSATEAVTRVWLLISYGFVLYWKQNKFLLAFDDFSHDFRLPRRNQPKRKKELQAKDVAVLFCCIYFAIANWMGWTKAFLSKPILDFLESFYKIGVYGVGLRDFPSNQLYFGIVSIVFWITKTYSFVLKFYMEGMLWASAWTLYSIQHKARSYTMNDETFEIKMGTDTFRKVIKLVRDLNRTLGPLRVVQFLVLIPYLVNIAYKAGNGEFNLIEVFQIPLQVGHFVVAAEASANMKNLIQHIVLFKINLTPEQRQNQMQWNDLTVKQNFFAMIASTPIALEGMDFFEVSYVVLGNIAGSVITYVLVILDWKRE